MAREGDTVARVDAEALQYEALSAIEGASTADGLEELRVRYLGRSSDLKLALREVRDRETGMSIAPFLRSSSSAIDAISPSSLRVQCLKSGTFLINSTLASFRNCIGRSLKRRDRVEQSW